MQASCKPDDTWVSEAHAPPPGARNNVIGALELLATLQDKENFIELVNEGITESSRRKVVTALRKFVEVYNHKFLVSFKLLDQRRVVKDVFRQAFDSVDYKDATDKQGLEELALRTRERRRQEACRHRED